MRRAVGPFALALALASPAAAQSSDPARTHAIGAGAQWGAPTASARLTPGVQLSWQRWLGPHLGVGAHVRWKTLETSRIADTERLDTRDDETRSSYGFGAEVLGRLPAGRLSLIVGIGPGVFVERQAYESLVNGTRHTGSDSFRTIGLQGLIEIDVRVADHLSAFAGLHVEWREFRSAESSMGYPAAGLRVVF